MSNDIDKMTEEELKDAITEYAHADGTELGDFLSALLTVAHDCCTFATDEFFAAVTKEMKEQLRWLRENFEIVEQVETRTVKHKRLKVRGKP